jgi:hypothetical protein
MMKDEFFAYKENEQIPENAVGHAHPCDRAQTKID